MRKALLIFALLVGVLIGCQGHQSLFRFDIPPGWKKMQVGTTKIVIDSPGEFVSNANVPKPEPGNKIVAFSLMREKTSYFIAEESNSNGLHTLLDESANQYFKRFQTRMPSAKLLRKVKLEWQGLPAVRLDCDFEDSGRLMHLIWLGIDGDKTTWVIEAICIDDAWAKSEINYLISSVEIKGILQKNTYAESIYVYVDEMPHMVGNSEKTNSAIVVAIKDRLVYPKAAQTARIQGRLFASFIVNSEGNVTDIKIVKGIEGLNDAAIAAIKALPKFVAGKQAGKNVSVSLTVPITFELPAKSTGIDW